MNHLDLCSGIGGFALAAQWSGYDTIGFCEIDPWCRRVLGKNFPGVPQHDDLWTLTGEVVRGWIASADSDNGRLVHNTNHGHIGQAEVRTRWHAANGSAPRLNLITGGYPCQPFSLAGKRLGAEDDRHLWPAIAALVADLRPARCLFENVAGHITMGLDAVLSDLEALGYTCWPVVIPAAAVGAPHRRDRVWILAELLADSERGGRWEPMRTDAAQGSLPEAIGREGASGAGSSRADVADAPRLGERKPADETLAVPVGREAWQVIGSGSDGGRGVLPDAISIGQPGPGAREHAGDQAPDRDRQAGDVVDADSTRSGTEAISGMGGAVDGLPGPLARSGWRVGPDVLNPWAGDWEGDIERTTTHEHDRTHKLKALGNAIVPQVAYEILRAWGPV